MGCARRHAYRTVVTVAMLRSVDLISDALPFGRFWFTGSNGASRAIECAVATPTPTQER